jgi:PKD repeat protein
MAKLPVCLVLALVVIAGALDPPVARLSASFTVGPVPLSVTFTDNSRGDVEARLLAYGDGTYSSAWQSTKIYYVAGTFIANLTVRNSAGSSWDSETISVEAPPPGQDSIAISCRDCFGVGTIGRQCLCLVDA